MARPAIELHPEAIAEARAAWLWYSERSEQAGRAFMQELDRAIELIRESPDRWPSYLHQTRRCLLHRFPYLVVYRQGPSGIQILAVAHGWRRPGYWRHRR